MRMLRDDLQGCRRKVRRNRKAKQKNLEPFSPPGFPYLCLCVVLFFFSSVVCLAFFSFFFFNSNACTCFQGKVPLRLDYAKYLGHCFWRPALPRSLLNFFFFPFATAQKTCNLLSYYVMLGELRFMVSYRSTQQNRLETPANHNCCALSQC